MGPVRRSHATRRLVFLGFDRSELGPDGRSVNIGDVVCEKIGAARNRAPQTHRIALRRG